MQKISPCLWFNDHCEEAINFYTSIFPNSRIQSVQRYPEGITEGPMAGMGGKVLTAIFELDGYTFQALDGGPMFTMNPSVSFMLNFDPSRDPNASENLSKLWDQLMEGGFAMMPLGEYDFSKKYGWVQDRFGVSWQLILTNPGGDPRPFIMPSMLFVGDAYGRAEEALRFYTTLFKDSQMGHAAYYPAGMEHDKEGAAMFADARLGQQWFVAMDSGYTHEFAFNEEISLSVECSDQAEVDHFWNAMTADGGQESMCGWLKDKFGVSWQIVPKQLGDYMTDSDPAKVARVTEAFMQMQKFDIAKLQAAYDGK